MTVQDSDPVPLPVHRTPGCPLDPPEELGRLQERGPIVRLTHQDGHVGWLITSYPLARQMLADPRFSARSDLRHVAVGPNGKPATTPPSPGAFINMDRPEHSHYRRQVSRHFGAQRLSALSGWIERTVTEHLDAMVAAGPPADLVSDFAMPVPSLVVCELLGIPEEDRNTVQRTSIAIANGSLDRGRGAGELWRYLLDLAARKRENPVDDLMSTVLAGNGLTDEELTNVAIGVVLGGHESTANMIALGTLALLQHPEQRSAMLADGADVDHAIDELMRHLTVTHVGMPYRAALEDVELGGVQVRKGDTVTVALPIVNRDPAVFDDPHRLRVDRPEAGRHLAFGYGPHLCIGQYLAKMELRIAYRALFERLPGLRLAVPLAEIPMEENTFIYGPRTLPVSWESGRAHRGTG